MGEQSEAGGDAEIRRGLRKKARDDGPCSTTSLIKCSFYIIIRFAMVVVVVSVHDSYLFYKGAAMIMIAGISP